MKTEPKLNVVQQLFATDFETAIGEKRFKQLNFPLGASAPAASTEATPAAGAKTSE